MITITIESDMCPSHDKAMMLANTIHSLLNDRRVGKVVESCSSSMGRFSEDEWFDLRDEKIQIRVE